MLVSGASPSISKRLNMCVPPPRLMFLALSGGSVAQCPLASCRVAIAALRVRLALVEAENLRVGLGGACEPIACAVQFWAMAMASAFGVLSCGSERSLETSGVGFVGICVRGFNGGARRRGFMIIVSAILAEGSVAPGVGLASLDMRYGMGVSGVRVGRRRGVWGQGQTATPTAGAVAKPKMRIQTKANRGTRFSSKGREGKALYTVPPQDSVRKSCPQNPVRNLESAIWTSG